VVEAVFVSFPRSPVGTRNWVHSELCIPTEDRGNETTSDLNGCYGLTRVIWNVYTSTQMRWSIVISGTPFSVAAVRTIIPCEKGFIVWHEGRAT